MTLSRPNNFAICCSIALILVFSSPLAVSTVSPTGSANLTNVHSPLSPAVSATPALKGTFAFVSNFESKTLEGWQSVQGAAPKVVTSVEYSGEPSLRSSASQGAQIDYATKRFVTGDALVSFQVAINNSSRTDAFFGLGSSDTNFVAVVGVEGGEVVEGSSLSTLSGIEAIPGGTAYPAGWVYISANVFSNGTMSVFVDQTEVQNASYSVPSAASYTGALIETVRGTAYFTDIVVSTYQLATYLPGYNNMEGYGQGSALNVKLLPAYQSLSAQMKVTSWSVPQNNILSFQINAMNSTGTLRSTCRGFFQLGVDINKDGHLAPWYVPGVNCEAHYFATLQGISTPPGTLLNLTISEAPTSLTFTIDDINTSQVFTQAISYNGNPFYSSYTQMEFQPCCAKFAISDYQLQGSIFGMHIITTSGETETLGANYMVPFELDAPPTWNLNYYVGSTAGYNEVST
jgi:hypothetical protein